MAHIFVSNVRLNNKLQETEAGLVERGGLLEEGAKVKPNWYREQAILTLIMEILNSLDHRYFHSESPLVLYLHLLHLMLERW